ncbi:ATP-activated inward rectifier K channel [Chara braunii]|uniref:ATP-activated inward rectifier K channel n=1 Tax=Chara braunii TaxID=69332 RepID=A0A388LW03_CHABU|nr:ATP-activated inward rectifier K channel [Chara braunii]|eukprot:GBG86441.1 ATP-activated inward rectifier K channel [Chara braunii]
MMGLDTPLLSPPATYTGTVTGTNPRNRKESKPPQLPLVDENGSLNLERKGFPKTFLYWGDMFHTLVNITSTKFTIVLFIAYFLLFVVFAVPYYIEAIVHNSIPGIHSFVHAVWFSVQTSMTIGYGGDLTPVPESFITNAVVALQSVTSLLVAYSLLGVVYARFSRPTRRATTIVFSKKMVINNDGGIPSLSFRIGNIRKHQLIEASVRMLVAFNNLDSEDEDDSVFRFINLQIRGGGQLFLALPCIVSHAMVFGSPLHNLDEEKMRSSDMEILVLLEAVDSSTSSKLQARKSYRPSDIKINYRFSSMVHRMPTGRRCVDFSTFQNIDPISENSPDYLSSFNMNPVLVETSSYEDFSRLQKALENRSGSVDGRQKDDSNASQVHSAIRRMQGNPDSGPSAAAVMSSVRTTLSHSHRAASADSLVVRGAQSVASEAEDMELGIPREYKAGLASPPRQTSPTSQMLQRGSGSGIVIPKRKKYAHHREAGLLERRRKREAVLSQLLLEGPNSATLQVLEHAASTKVQECEAQARKWRNALMELAAHVIDGDPEQARQQARKAMAMVIGSSSNS